MIVKRLSAINFRNLKKSTILPGDGVNVLYGDNAQGKTNLIEAIWLFTGSRSFRGSKDPEFIGFGSDFSRIDLEFFSRGSENNASISVSASKHAEYNGIKLDSVPALAGRFCAVVFSPDHLNLVKSGPQQRRKFIDGAITEILPRYAALLSEYRELLRQRNALLKDIPRHSELLDTLSVWDEKLAQTGASIIFKRMRYLLRLSPRAAEIYGGIAAKSGNAEETLALYYEAAGGPDYPSELGEPREAEKKIRESLLSLLSYQRNGDIENGVTRAGPHRDDLKISIGGADARLYGSQGQQRSAVLALKLAEADVLKCTIAEPPVLLLDDVMSELDRFRQDYILNSIGGCQVFITCCDPSGIESLEGGRVFRVSRGEVSQEE